MGTENKNNGLKSAIVVLSLLLVGSLGYIFKLTNEVNLEKSNVTSITTEKEKLVANLEAQKVAYDTAIAENTSISNELIAERDKVVQLLNEVKKSKGSIAELSKFKQNYVGLETKMKEMLVQVDELTNKNTKLTTKIDSTNVILDDEKKNNLVLKEKNLSLDKKIETASKLAIVNLNAVAYIVKSSGKQTVTDKASRTDAINFAFTIPENKIAVAQDLNYYIQIIDPENNVLGENNSISFDGKLLNYSFLKTVKFKNETIEVNEKIARKKFAKGNYTINVFDKSQLIKSAIFVLN